MSEFNPKIMSAHEMKLHNWIIHCNTAKCAYKQYIMHVYFRVDHVMCLFIMNLA